MQQKEVIDRTIKVLNQLPTQKAIEVADFADFVLKKYEEEILQKGMQKMVEGSSSFDFLREDEELYSLKDLKEKFK